MNNLILVLNCGSSSIKFALFEADTLPPLPRQPIWFGKADDVGGKHPLLDVNGELSTTLSPNVDKPYHEALVAIHTAVEAYLHQRQGHLVAIAHRVVHGGAKYFEPVRVDASVLADLRDYIPLAPLHQPFALEAIEALLASRPDLTQVACFDTAFHHTLPRVEKMLPLPHALWENGLRRYGFHGLSYEYQSLALPERHGSVANGRTIVAHLGSGASLCAMQNLRSVATTMGFSALDGLMMGTRCGALDPGAVLYLMEIKKLSLHDVGQLLYHDSGLLGVSGLSSDPRILLEQETNNQRVQDALDLYVRRIVREIGALVAVLGGLDMLVFTAGIGEHNDEIRKRICLGLHFLGIELDPAANASHAPVISTSSSHLLVAVEPTNEEWIAASHTHALLTDADKIKSISH